MNLAYQVTPANHCIVSPPRVDIGWYCPNECCVHIVNVQHRTQWWLTFRYVGDNDTNQEDDSIKPVVAEDESDDEEWNTEEDGHASDELNEVVNFLCNGCLASVQAGRQPSNTAHDCVVSAWDHNAFCRSCNNITE